VKHLNGPTGMVLATIVGGFTAAGLIRLGHPLEGGSVALLLGISLLWVAARPDYARYRVAFTSLAVPPASLAAAVVIPLELLREPFHLIVLGAVVAASGWAVEQHLRGARISWRDLKHPLTVGGVPAVSLFALAVPGEPALWAVTGSILALAASGFVLELYFRRFFQPNVATVFPRSAVPISVLAYGSLILAFAPIAFIAISMGLALVYAYWIKYRPRAVNTPPLLRAIEFALM
jgi:hypothetical protein